MKIDNSITQHTLLFDVVEMFYVLEVQVGSSRRGTRREDSNTRT